MKFTIPACIQAHRIGHWSYGTESEYDADGQLAPVRWICNCGSWMVVETLDPATDQRIAVPSWEKEKFLTEHAECVAKCYNCHVKPVERQGYWCEECDYQ
jgi:hypothetical protein